VTPGNIPWMLIGDDAGFWLLHKPLYAGSPTLGQGAVWTAVYFGDYNVWDIRNKWNFTLIGSTTSTSLLAFIIHAPGYASTHTVERSGSFVKGNVSIGILPFISNTYFGNNIAIGQTAGIQKLGGVFMKSPIHIYESVLIGNAVLGSLPGVYEPIMIPSTSSTTYALAADVPYEEFTDSEGGLSILVTTIGASGSYTPLSTGRLIFKIGKGFRNVQ